MVVCYFNPSSRAFTLCSHGSRIVLFSGGLAVQIFRPKERATFVTLSVECFIIVLFVVMGVTVMRLFSRNDHVDDVDASTENNQLEFEVRGLSPTGSQHDIEQGSGN